MRYQSKFALIVLFALVLISAVGVAQQKGQYVPGQFGLNAGPLPDPGITYANMTIHYNADSLRDANGDSVLLKGSTGFWANENYVTYVPEFKPFGAKLAITTILPAASGSLTLPTFGVTAGGSGFADTFVQPVTLGWSFARADVNIGYGFTAPTGRYVAGASDNVGSGYWGNNINSGTTFYLKKDKMLSADFYGNWEIHGMKTGSNVTPGQAFTDEWGLGQTMLLTKDGSRMLQLGVIGYDQWQVTDNGGMLTPLISAALVPHYQVHAAGFQGNVLFPKKNTSLFFKLEPEYLARSRPKGQTIVFGLAYTIKMPGTK